MELTKNKLRVCHFPQIPCKPFIVYVSNEREAYLVEQALINQHCFLLDEKIIPDYSNIISVEMYTGTTEPNESDDDWITYFNDDEMLEWEEFCEVFSEYVCTGIVNGD